MLNHKSKKVFYIATVAVMVFSIAFIYSVHSHFSYLQDKQLTEENIQTMQGVFKNRRLEIHNKLANAEKIAEVNAQIDIDTKECPVITAQKLTGNLNIVAYIFIEGTNIEGVVLQGEDNVFYLSRDMYKRPNVNGSIFMDYQNSRDFSDRSTIIYGHNMRNGSMFHDLRFFMQRDFLETNRYITVLTENKALKYEIFSAFSTSIDFDYIQTNFADDYVFDEFINELKGRAVNNTGVVVSSQDRILILSTCTNVQRDSRYVVVGKLVWTVKTPL